MAFRLIPREERFYDDFIAMAEQIRGGAVLLDAMLAPDRPLWDKADEIKEIEHKCDFLTHEIIQRLNRTFVTPLDREDIHALARSLDDVMDAIDASATILRLYSIDDVRPGARELQSLGAELTSQIERIGRKVGIAATDDAQADISGLFTSIPELESNLDAVEAKERKGSDVSDALARMKSLREGKTGA